MEETPVITDDFKTSMAQWVELKKQLTEARKDMKILNTREKELKTFIQGYMKEEKIDKVNLKKGKVSLRTSKKRAPFTKSAVQTGLVTYFDGDETKAETVMNFIVDSLEVNESNSISLTGLAKKESE